MAKFNTPEERAALLEEYKTSGLTIAAFCRQRGVGYSTMFKWMRDAGMPVQQQEQEPAPGAPPRFVEVEMESHENGAARPVPRAPKRPLRPASVLCAELVLPGGVVLRVYHSAASAATEGGAA